MNTEPTWTDTFLLVCIYPPYGIVLVLVYIIFIPLSDPVTGRARAAIGPSTTLSRSLGQAVKKLVRFRLLSPRNLKEPA